MDRMRRIIFATLAMLGLASAQAEEAGTAPMTAAEIEGVQRVEMVTIPMPGEFFAAMGKVDRPNWKKFLRKEPPTPTSNRAQIALALGTLVADGYIAVEAQDGQRVKNVGKDIINLAKKLNVSQSVLGRGNSINDFAENNDWSALREELEATQNEVKLDMEQQKDSSLITLVSVGAWVRGMEIVSGLVAETYSEEAARLLRQPAIIDYLLTRLEALPESMRAEPLVAAVSATLKTSLPNVSPEIPSLENVQALNLAMAELEAKITGSSSPSPEATAPSASPTPATSDTPPAES